MSRNVTNLVMDVWDEALLIESSIGEYLQPSKPGWYLPRSAQPLMYLDRKYYEKTSNGMVEITDVRNIRSTIYDAGGNIVFSYPPHGGRVVFHDHPMVPTIGLLIVQDYIEALLHNNLRWVRSKTSFSDRLKRHFRPEVFNEKDTLVQQYEDGTERIIGPYEGTSMESLKARYGEGISISRPEKIFFWCEEEIRSIMIHIRDSLAAFMGTDDNWRIYECELVNRSAMVKRLGDYRIWEWEKMHNDLKGEDLYVRRITDTGSFEFVRYEHRLGG